MTRAPLGALAIDEGEVAEEVFSREGPRFPASLVRPLARCGCKAAMVLS